jgi:hypothetical protein
VGAGARCSGQRIGEACCGCSATILRAKPNIKWAKDRGNEPEWPKVEYPWFCNWDEKTVDFTGGAAFDGDRGNDCHYTNQTKQAANDATKED